MNFAEIEKKVIKWAIKRNLINDKTHERQLVKLKEEFVELLCAKNKDEVIDAIGDMMVVMTLIANHFNETLTHCYETAYNEIKNRTGKTVNGIFIKEG